MKTTQVLPNIALIGRKGTGKTELAKLVQETHVPISFATPVKELSVEIYNHIARKIGSDARIDLDTLSQYKPQFRKLMQVVGTELGRDLFGHKVWVSQAETAVYTHLEAGFPVIVDDVRFDNELDALLRLDFEPIWIERELGGWDDQPSESFQLEDVQTVCTMHNKELTIIENDGKLEEFQNTFLDWLKAF